LSAEVSRLVSSGVEGFCKLLDEARLGMPAGECGGVGNDHINVGSEGYPILISEAIAHSISQMMIDLVFGFVTGQVFQHFDFE
jgi:hypothetical protein